MWNLKRLLLCDEIYFCAFRRDCGMIYNAHDALEDCEALASLIDHHHVPHHITIDNSFTYDYAVSKCRYRVMA